MNILHLSTSDISGGAALAAYRLHSGLRHLGHDSSMFVYQKHSSDDAVTVFTPPMRITDRLRRRLRKERIARSFARYSFSRPSGYEMFSDDRCEHGADPLGQLPPCDVINLHWIRSFVDFHTFLKAVSGSVPVVWTLHDMNTFTGGCHYDDGCGKFTDGCGACPQLGSSDTKDLSHKIWRRKKKIFRQIPEGRLHIITPSRWMADEVKRSALLGGRPVTVIPNSVDTEKFAPRDRHCAREMLGIPQEAKVVFFAAQSVNDRRKNFNVLAQALDGLGDLPDLFLISIGSGEPPAELQTPYLPLGYIANERLLSSVYSAADLFVIPALQDNLPNTVLESLASGTPVVGFNVGGIPDMVRPEITGILVPPRDTGALRAAIAELLQDEPKRANMRTHCRQIAEKEYALEIQARRYAEIYEKLFAESGK